MKLHDQFISFTQINTSEWLLTVANVNELQMNASIDLVFSCFFYFRLIFEKLKRHVERATIATDGKNQLFFFF